MKTILIIEDNLDVRENTAEILELANYKVLQAENGKQGVELAQQVKPDLIICDIMMPVLDGYGVLHMLSKNPETATIPFIFLTAKAERSELRKGMEMGADDYITKPFDDIELLNAIESRLKRKDVLRKDFAKNIEGLNDFLESAKTFDDLKKLSEEQEVIKYKKKENIYLEGNYPKAVYFVNKGRIKSYKTNEQGKEFITGLYKEGDFLGYMDLMQEGRYTDSAAVLEEAEVCLIPKDDFFSLIYKNAQVSRSFIKMIADNLKEKEEQLIKLAYNSVRKRVAEALITLNNRYGNNDAGSFSMSMPREDLASLAGTATETTIRMLGDLKDEGLIEVKGSTITILNANALARLKN
jgi:CRP-like cAMP-binding protein